MPCPLQNLRSPFLACAAFWRCCRRSITAFAQLRGHGGPVRALRFQLTDRAQSREVRFNGDPLVTDAQRCRASAAFPCRRRQRGDNSRDGRVATAGADGRIAIWTSGKAEPDAVLEGHTARLQRWRCHRTSRHWRRRRGIIRCGCGRLPAGARACSTATPRTSTGWRSRRMGTRWSASVTIRACASGRSQVRRSHRCRDAEPTQRRCHWQRW